MYRVLAGKSQSGVSPRDGLYTPRHGASPLQTSSTRKVELYPAMIGRCLTTFPSCIAARALSGFSCFTTDLLGKDFSGKILAVVESARPASWGGIVILKVPTHDDEVSIDAIHVGNGGQFSPNRKSNTSE